MPTIKKSTKKHMLSNQCQMSHCRKSTKIHSTTANRQTHTVCLASIRNRVQGVHWRYTVSSTFDIEDKHYSLDVLDSSMCPFRLTPSDCWFSPQIFCEMWYSNQFDLKASHIAYVVGKGLVCQYTILFVFYAQNLNFFCGARFMILKNENVSN